MLAVTAPAGEVGTPACSSLKHLGSPIWWQSHSFLVVHETWVMFTIPRSVTLAQIQLRYPPTLTPKVNVDQAQEKKLKR